MRLQQVRGRTHSLFQCQACWHQTSLIAGTSSCRAPTVLTVGFAITISQAKTIVGAALMRQLGVSYLTALVDPPLMRDGQREARCSQLPEPRR